MVFTSESWPSSVNRCLWLSMGSLGLLIYISALSEGRSVVSRLVWVQCAHRAELCARRASLHNSARRLFTRSPEKPEQAGSLLAPPGSGATNTNSCWSDKHLRWIVLFTPLLLSAVGSSLFLLPAAVDEALSCIVLLEKLETPQLPWNKTSPSLSPPLIWRLFAPTSGCLVIPEHRLSVCALWERCSATVSAQSECRHSAITKPDESRAWKGCGRRRCLPRCAEVEARPRTDAHKDAWPLRGDRARSLSLWAVTCARNEPGDLSAADSLPVRHRYVIADVLQTRLACPTESEKRQEIVHNAQ